MQEISGLCIVSDMGPLYFCKNKKKKREARTSHQTDTDATRPLSLGFAHGEAGRTANRASTPAGRCR